MFSLRNKFQAAFTAVILLSTSPQGFGFSPFSGFSRSVEKIQGETAATRNSDLKERNDVAGVIRTSAAVVLASVILTSNPVYADEFGRETEAPTLFTGETVMVRIVLKLASSDIFILLMSFERFVQNGGLSELV